MRKLNRLEIYKITLINKLGVTQTMAYDETPRVRSQSSYSLLVSVHFKIEEEGQIKKRLLVKHKPSPTF